MGTSKYIIRLRKRTTSQLPTWATECIDSASHPRGDSTFVKLFLWVNQSPGMLFTEGLSKTCISMGEIHGKFPMEATLSTLPHVPVQGFGKQSDLRDIGEQNPWDVVLGGAGRWARGAHGFPGPWGPWISVTLVNKIPGRCFTEGGGDVGYGRQGEEKGEWG